MRARLLDPQTSQQAAAQAAVFAGSHCQRIQAALEDGPLSAKEISRITGLTVVQVDRRLPELERQGKTQVAKEGGIDMTRNGYRVWRLTA
jgi:predicted ArsR family transcriptional regulator